MLCKCKMKSTCIEPLCSSDACWVVGCRLQPHLKSTSSCSSKHKAGRGNQSRRTRLSVCTVSGGFQPLWLSCRGGASVWKCLKQLILKQRRWKVKVPFCTHTATRPPKCQKSHSAPLTHQNIIIAVCTMFGTAVSRSEHVTATNFPEARTATAL